MAASTVSPLTARSPHINGSARIATYNRSEGLTKMREGKLAVFFGGTLTLLSAAANAGAVPKDLYHKSISGAWTESVTGKYGTE